MIHISNLIQKQRNLKIIRKLSNFEDEVENLYNFIKTFKTPEFNLYEYQNLMRYVNSYIIEKNNKITACINIIQIDSIYIVFDFFSNEIQDLYLLIQFVVNHISKNISMLIFDFPNNYFDLEHENQIHESILYFLNLKDYWTETPNLNNYESLFFIINEYLKSNHSGDYILKKFYNNFVHNIWEHKISKFEKMTLQ